MDKVGAAKNFGRNNRINQVEENGWDTNTGLNAPLAWGNEWVTL